MTQESALVLGATSLVGTFLMRRLSVEGVNVIGLCRKPPVNSASQNWIADDLENIDGVRNEIPRVSSVFSVGPIHLLPKSLPIFFEKGADRVIAFSSTSAGSKRESEIAHERIAAHQFIDGERQTIEICEAHGIRWTILRPTMIYVEGVDKNISRIARLIQKFHVFPLAGTAHELRQPVHGDDLAAAAVKVRLIEATIRKIYDVPGGETLRYAEMVGRIFDSLDMPRRVIPIPVSFWKMAFSIAGLFLPGATSAMGSRMSEDLVFDSTPAKRDFGWAPRDFHPIFAMQAVPRN
jgi:nucleoside-diphosphate-sugar epimerase